MIALIVLENHFYVDKGNNVWCDRVVDYNYLRRYLNVFDNIVVCGRSQKKSSVNDKLLVSGNNVKFVELPDFRGAKGTIKNIFKIRRIINEQVKSVDCVIYRAPTHLSLFTYDIVLSRKKVLGLEFMMAADKMFDGNSNFKKVMNKWIDKKAKKMCLKANGVSYVTEHKLQERYPCKALLSQNKNYCMAFYSSIDLDKSMFCNNNWKIENKPDKYNIIHIGYMDSYRKGQDILLKAAKIVKNRGYNFSLTFIGDGKLKKEFIALADELGLADITNFKGSITNKKVILDELKQSHLFVFPTQSEGLPRTIIEAMSQGLPCISSPVDGIPELLDDGFLIDYNNYEEYANKICELFDNWEIMIKIGKSNYKKSLKYEKSIIDDNRNKFYQNLVEIVKLNNKSNFNKDI